MIPAKTFTPTRKPLSFKLDESTWSMRRTSWKHDGPTFTASAPAVWLGKKNRDLVLYSGRVSFDWLGVDIFHFPQLENVFTKENQLYDLPPGLVVEEEFAIHLNSHYPAIGRLVEAGALYTLDPQPLDYIVSAGAALETLAASMTGTVLPPRLPGYSNWYMKE